MSDNTIEAFFALVRAGLWGNGSQDIRIEGTTDWQEVYRLAAEQLVQGLVLAGIERTNTYRMNNTNRPPQALLLQWIGEVQMIEQRNNAMNCFISSLVEQLRKEDIYTLLVKGQGIAQCYERPQWRTSGDIDFFLSNTNYKKAKSFLFPLSSSNKPERVFSKELGLNIDSWYVEIHGTLRTGLSTRLDKEIDSVQREVFYGGRIRLWQNGKTRIFLPSVNEDVYFVFTHFVKHFYKEGGVSIRQLCDWSRLIWTFRSDLDLRVLETRIRKAGLLAEWRAFAKLAVDYLGMPVEAMPLYSKDKKWSKKAEMIVAFFLKGGKWHRFKDTFRVGFIFPQNTFRFLPGIILSVTWLKIKDRLFKS